MGAPKGKQEDKRIGNQFWKLRSKHGRDKLFASPELMWEAACEYFQWCEDNPDLRNDFKGKDAGEVFYTLKKPFTIEGLCRHLNCNKVYFNNFELNNKDASDFSEVITRIRETIYEQKYTGAAQGLFNPNIIARDLGLSDKKEITKVKMGKDKETWEDD